MSSQQRVTVESRQGVADILSEWARDTVRESLLGDRSSIERGLVGLISALIPYLAPAPSAYFVYRSSVEHLEMVPTFAFVAAAVVEGLGIASVHLAMDAWEWNRSLAEGERERNGAPFGLAVVMGVVYLITAIGLAVVLEAIPGLAIWAPAIFPLLALVGAFNLVLYKQQRIREREHSREQRDMETRNEELRTALRQLGEVRRQFEEYRQDSRETLGVLRREVETLKEQPASNHGAPTATVYESEPCPHCGREDFKNPQARGGHVGNCPERPEKVSLNGAGK